MLAEAPASRSAVRPGRGSSLPVCFSPFALPCCDHRGCFPPGVSFAWLFVPVLSVDECEIKVIKETFKDLCHLNGGSMRIDKETFLQYLPLPGLLGGTVCIEVFRRPGHRRRRRGRRPGVRRYFFGVFA